MHSRASSAASEGGITDVGLQFTQHVLFITSQGDCMFRIDTRPGTPSLVRLDTICHIVSSMSMYFDGGSEQTILETSGATVAIVGKNGVLAVAIGQGEASSQVGMLRLVLLHNLFMRLFPTQIEEFIAREGAETARQLEAYTVQDVAQSGREHAVCTNDRFESFTSICKSILHAETLCDLWFAPHHHTTRTQRSRTVPIVTYIVDGNANIILSSESMSQEPFFSAGLRPALGHPLARVCAPTSRDVWRVVKESIEQLQGIVPLQDTVTITSESMSNTSEQHAVVLDPTRVAPVLRAITLDLALLVRAVTGPWDSLMYLVSFIDTTAEHTTHGGHQGPSTDHNAGSQLGAHTGYQNGKLSKSVRRGFDKAARAIHHAFPSSKVPFDRVLHGVLKSLCLTERQQQGHSGGGGGHSVRTPQTPALTPLTSNAMFHITMTPASTGAGGGGGPSVPTPGSIATPSALQFELAALQTPASAAAPTGVRTPSEESTGSQQQTGSAAGQGKAPAPIPPLQMNSTTATATAGGGGGGGGGGMIPGPPRHPRTHPGRRPAPHIAAGSIAQPQRADRLSLDAMYLSDGSASSRSVTPSGPLSPAHSVLSWTSSMSESSWTSDRGDPRLPQRRRTPEPRSPVRGASPG